MLVLHPSSTCDICLDNYGSGDRLPHAISCGHVFCQGCLESLTRPQCPLCRTRFRPQDIMRLHIDRSNSPRASMTASRRSLPDPSPEDSPDEARKFQDIITRIVLEGAPASQLRTLIDDCHSWLRTQEPGQHTGLRASFLLVYNLTETQRKQAATTKSLSEAKVQCESLQGECDDLRSRCDSLHNECEALGTRIISEREEADRKYQDLARANADEKETAIAVEKSLRQHYEQLDAEWRGKWDVAVDECRILRSKLRRYELGLNGLTEPQRSIEVRYFQVEPDRQVHVETRTAVVDDAIHDSENDIKQMKETSQAPEDMFHLSPLPANIPPFPSAILGFAPLADDDDDELKKKRDPSSEQKPIPYPFGRRITEPIPISSSAPRMPSGLSISIPKGHDLSSGSGLSRSLPRGCDVAMNGRPPSPPGRSSSAMPHFSQGQSMAQEQRRENHPHPLSREHCERSDPGEQRDRWRSKLYEILDSPGPTPSSSIPRSYTEPMSHRPRSRSPSRDARSASRTPPLAQPSASTKPSASVVSSTQPTNIVLSQPSYVSNLTATQRGDINRPTLISHASSAAMALERERQRAERERHKQTQSQSQGSSGSLRDKDGYGKDVYGKDVYGKKHYGMGNGKDSGGAASGTLPSRGLATLVTL